MPSRARIRPNHCRALIQVPHVRATTLFSSQQRHASTENAASGSSPKVIFSGIQPTGVPHLGNYLGALKSWATLQDTAAPTTSLLFSVVDLHAITVPQNAVALRTQRREMLAALLAVGLDPARSTIFYQSSVPAHAELMWILSCTASMGYLSRMTQWKSKLSLSEDTSALDDKAKTALKLGLFSYPVLQAADIMVHRATHVPVGEDQKQHLEFARECATNFNATYGGTTLIPPEVLLSPARRVMSLTNPTAKMSKSDPVASSRILITDDAAQIRKKITRALTDCQTDAVTYDRIERPGVSNLLEILAILEGQSVQDTVELFKGMRQPFKLLKERTGDAVVKELEGVGEKFRELVAKKDGTQLDEIEAIGAEKARKSADATMRLVKQGVGL